MTMHSTQNIVFMSLQKGSEASRTLPHIVSPQKSTRVLHELNELQQNIF